MKNFVLGILFTLIVLALGTWSYYRFGFADIRANVASPPFESSLARSALRASAARHAPQQANPIQPTEANLLDGARLYRDKCADCHGRPDNPSSDYGLMFYPPAPQFMNMHIPLAENQIFYVVKFGIRRSAMPAWGNIMADSEIWQVVTLLDHINNLPPAAAQELHRPALSSP